jgi:hypothetical protein
MPEGRRSPGSPNCLNDTGIVDVSSQNDNFIDAEQAQQQLRDGLSRSRQLVIDAQSALTDPITALNDAQEAGDPSPIESAAG